MELISILAENIEDQLFEHYLHEGRIDDFKNKLNDYIKKNVMDKESAKKILKKLVRMVIKFGKKKPILLAHILVAFAIYLSPLDIKVTLSDEISADTVVADSIAKMDSIPTKESKSISLMSYENFKDSLAQKESSNIPYIASTSGYIGKYQFGTLALIDGGVAPDRDSATEFRQGFVNLYQEYKNASEEEKDSIKQQLNDYFPEATQDVVFDQYIKQQEKYLINGLKNRGKDISSLDELVGDTIGGIRLSKSGLLAATHLVGYKGVVDFITSNGDKVAKDGNGVPLTNYLEHFANYAIKD